MVPGNPSSAATGVMVFGGIVAATAAVVASCTDLTSATGTDTLGVVGLTAGAVTGVAAAVVVVVVSASGIKGGGCVGVSWFEPEELVDKDFEVPMHGISTAIRGRASIRGRGAEEVASKAPTTPSDWLADGEEDEEAAELDAAAAAVLKGGVAGSRKRFCFVFMFGFLFVVLPDMREGGYALEL